MQPTLFDVGRAHLPPRVLMFASGVNEAREIRGFSLARIPIGFSAGHVREEAIAELHRSELPLFADSGAFSEVAVTRQGLSVVRPISHRDWLKRLSLYQCLAERHGCKLSPVVPDRVGTRTTPLSFSCVTESNSKGWPPPKHVLRSRFKGGHSRRRHSIDEPASWSASLCVRLFR